MLWCVCVFACMRASVLTHVMLHRIWTGDQLLFANVTLWLPAQSSLSFTLRSYCGQPSWATTYAKNPGVYVLLFSPTGIKSAPRLPNVEKFYIVYASVKSTLFWSLWRKRSFLQLPLCGRQFPFKCSTTRAFTGCFIARFSLNKSALFLATRTV